MKTATDLWFEAAGSYELLSRERTMELLKDVKAWQAGGPEEPARRALDLLMKHNLRVVPHFMKRFYPQIASRDPRFLDMLQEGCFGIRQAAIRFSFERNTQFSTVMGVWVRKYLSDYVRSHSRTIRISTECLEVVSASLKATDRFMSAHGRAPSIAELAKKLDKKESLIRRAMDVYQSTSTRSLSARASKDDEGGTLEDLTPDNRTSCNPDFFERAEKAASVLEQVFEKAGLNETERALVTARDLMSPAVGFKTIEKELGSGRDLRTTYAKAIRRCQEAAQALNLASTGILSHA